MPFNSFVFLVAFLPVVTVGYWIARTRVSGAAARAWLIAASLAFYAYGSIRTLHVLLVSVAVNWLLGRMLAARAAAGRPSRRLLALAIVLNVLLLAIFKYSRFVVENIGALTHTRLVAPAIVFPLGVSFFTLQQIMYIVDCHEGLIPPNGFHDHLLFVSFFPYISAGPITRCREVVAQFPKGKGAGADYDALARGLFLFAIGLFKKTVLADGITDLVDNGFGGGAVSQLQAWMSSVGFSLQLYFDFSGYSDMALGVGLMLGMTLPRNFDGPYRASSIIDFWRRWHITLSDFITTYLYTPMVRGFGKVTLAKAMFATMIAMLIAGLWHGPAWTYVIFGGLHGIGLVVNQLWRKRVKRRIPKGLSVALTLALVDAAFVFFRSPTVAVATRTLVAMAGIRQIDRFAIASTRPQALLLLVLGVVIVAFAPNSNALAERFRPGWRSVALAVAALLTSLLYLNSGVMKEFVYVDF